MLPGSLVLFAAGMALAVLSIAAERGELDGGALKLVARAPWLAWLAALGVEYAVQELGFLYRHGLAAWWLPTLVLKALVAALLLAPLVFGTDAGGWLRRALSARVLLWLGAISYGFYLWHQPLLDKLAPRLVSDGPVLTGVAAAAVTAAVASLSYYALERPAQQFANRWLRRGHRSGMSHRHTAPALGPDKPAPIRAAETARPGDPEAAVPAPRE